jgi:hypothetical protein
MGFRPKAVAAGLALVTLSALFVAAGSQAALAGAAVSQDGAGWRVVYRSGFYLTAVAASSASDVWAFATSGWPP